MMGHADVRVLLVAALLVPAVAVGTAVPQPAQNPRQPTAAGLWEAVDGDTPAAWFRIVECDGVYQGRMVKIFLAPPGKDPAEWRCTACRGGEKNAPVIGLTFIRGMKRQGLTYEGGTILDPRTGLVYGARLDLSPDGRQLGVRGFLGIELLGHTEMWRRLPDDALPAGYLAGCS